MSFPPPSERQARVIWLALTGLAIAALVALAAGLVWGLGQVLHLLAPVLWPIAVASVLAYLLDPVVDFCTRKGIQRPRAILLVFALALVLVAGLFGSVVPQLVRESRQLAVRVPAYATRLHDQVEAWVNHPPTLLQRFLKSETTAPAAAADTNTVPTMTSMTTNDAGALQAAPGATNNPAFLGGTLDRETLQNASNWLAKVLPTIGWWLFGQVGRLAAWFGVLAGLALVPVYAFYFLLEKQRISARWTDYLPMTDSHFKTELVFVLNAINNYLIAFFRGQVLVAMCDGVLYGVGFLLVGIPYAALIGALAVLLTMIPFVGAIVTCVLALTLALVQYGDWLHPVLVLAVFGCVQALEGLVISPRIMGGRVGLHPVMIIISVMAGTTLLGGLLGGILAIPLTAALRVVMFRYIWKRPKAE